MTTKTMPRTGAIAAVALRCELDRTKAENVQLRGVIARQNDQIRALRAQLSRSIENQRDRVRRRDKDARREREASSAANAVFASGGRRAERVSPEAKE